MSLIPQNTCVSRLIIPDSEEVSKKTNILCLLNLNSEQLMQVIKNEISHRELNSDLLNTCQAL